MTSYIPRSDRTRTVTEARLLAFINAEAPRFADGGSVDVTAPLVVWGGQDEGESFIPLRAAECVCEEPCRYCHCKEAP